MTLRNKNQVRVWDDPLGGNDFEGTVDQLRAHIKEGLLADLGSGEGTTSVGLYPIRGRHVKTYAIEINIQLRRTPENDYLMEPSEGRKDVD